MTTNQIKPPTWFWAISILALLWNLMGVGAYLADAFISIEDLEALTQEQRLLYESRPAWVTASFAIAVWGGALGCIGLLLRKKWAKSIFIISLLGVLAQNLYQFFLSDTFEVMGSEEMILPIVVIIISFLLVWFASWADKKGYLS